MYGNNTMDGFILIVGFAAVIVGGYILPTLIAVAREHRQTFAIIVLNVLTGWTFIGWVAALVWACTADTKQRARGTGIMTEWSQ
jgi:hypothetical protein